MSINFEAALGVHGNALALRSQRAEVLANNIVNADTPGYKARDLDFGKLLKLTSSDMASPRKTNARHFSVGSNISASNSDNGLLYRKPLQPSIDGNTVDLQIEQAEYAKNALRFQASFTFLDNKVRGLKAAIRGE